MPLLNMLYGFADALWARNVSHRPRTLPVLLLFTTYRCNLRCAMCGVRHHPTDDELSSAEYRNILDAAQRLHTSLMLISGGEALCRGDIVYEVIQMAEERGIAAHLCSNGRLIDTATAVRLDQSGLSSLSISLESAHQEIHDAIRGQGTFAAAVNALQTLRQCAPNIRCGINCTITALNYKNLNEMVSFAESLGVHQIKFAPIHTNLLHSEKPAGEFEPLLFSKEQLKELEGEMKALIAALRSSRILTNHPRYLQHLAASLHVPPRFRCYAGYAACTIDPYGYVSPCPDWNAGLSARNMPLDMIWRSDAYQQLRQRVCECGARCWDPLYTELSLRMAPQSLWIQVMKYLREMKFYYRTHGNVYPDEHEGA